MTSEIPEEDVRELLVRRILRARSEGNTGRWRKLPKGKIVNLWTTLL
jgi:hypothetical protein